MVCIKDLHSQQCVIAKPCFTALRQVLAMEAHRPQCQLAAENHRSFETHLLRKKKSVFGMHNKFWNPFPEGFSQQKLACRHGAKLIQKNCAFTSTVSGPASCFCHLPHLRRKKKCLILCLCASKIHRASACPCFSPRQWSRHQFSDLTCFCGRGGSCCCFSNK